VHIGASIHFRSTRLETAVGTQQRSDPDRNFTVRRETFDPEQRARARGERRAVTLEKEKEKKRTRFPVTGGISRVLRIAVIRKLTTRPSPLHHDESHLGTAQRDGQLPKYHELRNSARYNSLSSLIYCGLDD
jgi:hypothetical protein